MSVALLLAAALAGPAPAGELFRPGEVLARLRPDAPRQAARAARAPAGFEVVEEIRLPTGRAAARAAAEAAGPPVLLRLRLPEGVSVEEAVARLAADPAVAYAEPNYLVRKALTPTDPFFPLQWGLGNSGQAVDGIAGTPGADVAAPDAWDLAGQEPVVVAVIDTGVDFLHPDLAQSIWTNPGESGPDGDGNDRATNGLDDDANGYVDDVRGWNFPRGNNNPMDDDVVSWPYDRTPLGHGTHVAGTIAAAGNNGVGTAGVAWGARIMPLKFLDHTGGGDIADEVKAIAYAVQMGARVINASFGFPAYCGKVAPSQAERDAIAGAEAAGVLFVAAAGNFGCNNDVTPFYPGSYGLPNILSVAASDSSDGKPSFSNYGAASVHLAAPGKDIYSTVRVSARGYDGHYGYDLISGTSMAAPFVSGAAALVLSVRPHFTHREVKEVLLGSVDPLGTFEGRTQSGGRLNLRKALQAAREPLVRLEAPSELAARVVEGPAVNLAWKEPSKAPVGIRIERRDGETGEFAEIARLPTGSPGYTDGDVVPQVLYVYRARADDGLDTSDFSNETSAVIPVPVEAVSGDSEGCFVQALARRKGTPGNSRHSPGAWTSTLAAGVLAALRIGRRRRLAA